MLNRRLFVSCAVCVPHVLQNDSTPMKIASTYVAEKGKPLATPAPE